MRPDQVARLVGQRDVQAHDVRQRHELVEIRDVALFAGRSARVVEHLHPESSCPSRHGLSDPPEPDESEHRTIDVASEILIDPPAVPTSCA